MESSAGWRMDRWLATSNLSSIAPLRVLHAFNSHLTSRSYARHHLNAEPMQSGAGGRPSLSADAQHRQAFLDAGQLDVAAADRFPRDPGEPPLLDHRGLAAAGVPVGAVRFVAQG